MTPRSEWAVTFKAQQRLNGLESDLDRLKTKLRFIEDLLSARRAEEGGGLRWSEQIVRVLKAILQENVPMCIRRLPKPHERPAGVSLQAWNTEHYHPLGMRLDTLEATLAAIQRGLEKGSVTEREKRQIDRTIAAWLKQRQE